MKICDEKAHGEIVHDEWGCPVCAVLQDKDGEIDALRDQVKSLEKDVQDKDDEIDALRDQVKSLEKAVLEL